MEKGAIIAKGVSADIFAWGEEQILKLFYEESPSWWIEQEINIADRLKTTGLPVPTFVDSIEIDGRKGLIYRRIVGPSIEKMILKKPWMLKKMAHQFAELHTEIHKHRIDGIPSMREDFLACRIRRAQLLSEEQKEKILNVLYQLPDDNVLCHNDLRPSQILLTGQGPIILDWTLAHSGNPLADVARTLTMIRVSVIQFKRSWFQYLLIQIARKTFCNIYLQHYLALHPDVTRAQIETWVLPVMASRLGKDSFIAQHFGQKTKEEETRLLPLIEDLLLSHT